ncbi:DNA polymerase III subunit delta [uncultured Megasphaera sp.]|uniref:DNA polymerase III subunit delta n=1 Tax=uncultured Megasphaera sp. TaxID=165188 RepID=UPI0025DA902F|nr:DNA polymerase III subunit delta [uncultured Megasphaera sp.]
MNNTKNIMIIYGSESYLMEEGRRRFFDAARKRAGGDAEVQSFQKDAAAATVVESFQGTSLFSSGTVTVWYDCPFLPLKRGGRSRSKLNKEEQWFLDEAGRLDGGNSLLFYSKGNMDTGSAFFKALKPMAEVVAADAVTEKTIMPYVTAYLKDRGKSLSREGIAFLQSLFQTWGSISLLYVFSELDKLCITLPDGKQRVDTADLGGLFAGTMEKNLFTFMDAFLSRNGEKTLPFVEGLFSRQDAFLKNTGYMLSRLRLLLAYKELLRAHAGQRQREQVLQAVNKGRSVKYVLYHLQKVASYWTIEELERCICNIFTLQLHIRCGKASPADMGALICLYCSVKR